MNDDALKDFLQNSLEQAPSSNFNHQVLSRVPVAAPQKKKHLVSVDEPLILLLFLAAAAFLCVLFALPGDFLRGTDLLLIAFGLAMLGGCIILFNLVTARRYRQAGH